jgi:hypothetical protein
VALAAGVALVDGPTVSVIRPRDSKVIMSNRTAEIVGAHMALSTSIALTWRRVVHGELEAEDTAALIGRAEEREHPRRIFTPLTPERDEQLLTSLLARREATKQTGARGSARGLRGKALPSAAVPAGGRARTHRGDQ